MPEQHTLCLAAGYVDGRDAQGLGFQLGSTT